MILVAGGLVYYKEVVMAAEASEEEEIVLEENQEWKYFKITQILGNEMTATVVQEDGEETTESGTWMIPVGTEVVTKLGTTTTFARLASGDTIKVLMQNEDDGTQDSKDLDCRFNTDLQWSTGYAGSTGRGWCYAGR